MSTPITLTGTVDGSNATFTAAVQVVGDLLYLDRILEDPRTDYTLTNNASGCTIVFATAPNPFVIGTPDTAAQHIQLYGTSLGILSVSTPTTSKTGFLAAGTIINRAAVQCGLTAVSDPYASTDANFVQLVELLNMVGGDLLSAHEWANFIRLGTITTANSATGYALPADYDRMVDQTQWNNSTRFSMIGPLTGQETRYLAVRLAGVLVQVAYRLQGNVITFAIAPTNAQTLTFEYISNFWVWSAAGTGAPDASTAVAAGDTVLYDPDLAIAALRLAYLDAKGFDTVSASDRYDSKLEHAISKNVGSKILNIGGSGINADHLIDASNLPITGYA